MKKEISIFLFLFTVFSSCISCNDSTKQKELDLKEKELAIKEKELELKERSIRLTDDSIKLKKTESAENNLHKKDSSNSQSYNNKNQISEETQPNKGETKFVYVYVSTNEPEIKLENKFLPSGSMESKLAPVPTFYTYKSEIMEVKNFTEDVKYKIIDNYEAQVREGFTMKNIQLNEHNTQCKILSSECYAFDTYKTASQHKRSN